MRHQSMRSVLVLVALAASLLPVDLGTAQVGQPVVSNEGRVRYFPVFSGESRLRSGETVQLDIRKWSIGGGLQLDALPMEADGVMIVQLRSGELTTTINGQRQQRRENDYWTVPSGARMGVATEDDTAVLETTVVRMQQ